MSMEPVAALPAVVLEEKSGPVEDEVSSGISRRQKSMYGEEVALVEIAKLFDMLDTDDNKKIERNEFKKSIARLDLHRPEGAAEGWKDDAFDKFDVDGKGEIDYAEFCFAIGQTALAAHAQGRNLTALEIWKEVLSETQVAQTEAKNTVAAVDAGAKDEYSIDAKRKEKAQDANVAALHQKSKDDAFNDSAAAVCLVAACPCYLCCSNLSEGAVGDPITGLQPVVQYITTCKSTNADYYWSIQARRVRAARPSRIQPPRSNRPDPTAQIRPSSRHALAAGPGAALDPRSRLARLARAELPLRDSPLHGQRGQHEDRAGARQHILRRHEWDAQL